MYKEPKYKKIEKETRIKVLNLKAEIMKIIQENKEIEDEFSLEKAIETIKEHYATINKLHNDFMALEYDVDDNFYYDADIFIIQAEVGKFLLKMERYEEIFIFENIMNLILNQEDFLIALEEHIIAKGHLDFINRLFDTNKLNFHDLEEWRIDLCSRIGGAIRKINKDSLYPILKDLSKKREKEYNEGYAKSKEEELNNQNIKSSCLNNLIIYFQIDFFY